jgi:hypothetical protein
MALSPPIAYNPKKKRYCTTICRLMAIGNINDKKAGFFSSQCGYIMLRK